MVCAMDPSTANRRVYRLIAALSEERGWTSRLEIQKHTGIDRGTLARWRDGGGRKTDWFEKAETAFDLEEGTLARVRAGELSVEEVLGGGEAPAEPESVEFASGIRPEDLPPEKRAAYEWHLEQARKLLEGDE